MWEVTENQVVAAFQQDDGGARFTAFMNALIRAEMYLSQAPLSEFILVDRSTVGDGGVDAEVKCAIPGDRTRWMKEHPTLWQFTARDGTRQTLKKLEGDLNKPYASALLKRGYACRACIRGLLQPQELDRWEKELTDVAKLHNANTPTVAVLTASRLALWASMVPGIAADHLRVSLPQGALHFRAWGANATADIPEYVQVPQWAAVKADIRRHADFTQDPAEAVVEVIGESGVGKTRLTYEVLKEIPGADGLVIYTADGDVALGIASFLANNAHTRAILVADECDPLVTRRLEDGLRGHRQRIRVVAIAGPEPLRVRRPGGSFVEQMPVDVLEKVLERNFRDVSPADRRAIASVTHGFVLTAKFLCRRAASGQGVDLDAALEDLHRRVPGYVGTGSLFDALLLLSFLKKVGFKGGLERELELLCSLAGDYKADEIRDAGKHLRDTCGFVGVSSRYMYVTPPIVARWAFDRAWKRWAEDAADSFVGKIPPELIQSFLDQVSEVGSTKAQEAVARFFLGWASKLSPADLARVEVSDRLEALTEAQPGKYLPLLRRLLESATDEQLAAIPASGTGGRWGPRLHLVWLSRNLAAFDKCFDDTEAILLRLAVSESTDDWRHNAAENWVHLFRLRLSGTSRPFQPRLLLLRRRLLSEDGKQSQLAVRALKGAIENAWADVITGEAIPEYVGGRVTPREWQPATWEEYVDCRNRLLELLREAVMSHEPGVAGPAMSLLVEKTSLLLWEQELKYLRDLIGRIELPQALLPKLQQEVAQFLYVQEHYSKPDHKLPAAYLQGVRDWAKGLVPKDMHGRVVAVVGKDAHFYTRTFLGDAEASELQNLAKDLFGSPDELRAEMSWLLSSDALSAAALGEELGKLDADVSLLAMLFKESGRTGSAQLGKGYIAGLMKHHPEHIDVVNRALSALEKAAPEVAFEFAVSAGEKVAPLERTLAQVKAGKVAASRLVGFLWTVGNRSPSVKEFGDVLEVITDASGDMDEGHMSWAVTLLAYRLHSDRKGETESVLEDERARGMVWRLLEVAIEKGRLGGEASYWLEDILGALQDRDPERAASLATKGLMSEGLRFTDACKKVLESLAKKHPRVVMKHIGPVMLDPETAWRFHVDQYRGIFWSIDEGILKEWLQEHGVEAARALARHLQPPALDSNGEPLIPPLTEFVLSKFEEDDGVAAAFSAGVHGMEVGVGDLSGRFRELAEFARKFLGHPLRRVHEWAEGEVASCEADAKRFKQWEEERWLE